MAARKPFRKRDVNAETKVVQLPEGGFMTPLFLDPSDVKAPEFEQAADGTVRLVEPDTGGGSQQAEKGS